MPRRLSVQEYVAGVSSRDRAVLGQAITLIESKKPSDRALASEVLEHCLSGVGDSIRVGITGVPGVGKSTLLENFGMHLINQGLSVAVLAVDPSSSRTGGSILGDKTRMQQLSVSQQAFVRPSPTDTHLGGVARKTRESIILCEAAGFDVVIVESVGVGQSEIVLAGMVDCFVGLMLPNAGDELQGIKKGLLEWVDIVAINKSDGPNRTSAEIAQKEYQSAFHYLPQRHECWMPKTLLISGLYGDGIPELWQLIRQHQDALKESGGFIELRKQQQESWLLDSLKEHLWMEFENHPEIKNNRRLIHERVVAGKMSVAKAVQELWTMFKKS